MSAFRARLERLAAAVLGGHPGDPAERLEAATAEAVRRLRANPGVHLWDLADGLHRDFGIGDAPAIRALLGRYKSDRPDAPPARPGRKGDWL